MTLRALATALGLLAAAPGAAAAATPQIHAHRGGAFVDGTPTYAENTLPAFQAAHARGFVVELDSRAVQDGAVSLHDDTLDRTTPCTGAAADMTLAAVAACPSDTVGSPESSLGSQPRPGGPPPPNLAEVLAWARDAGARLNLEINDHDPARVGRVLDVIAASGYPARRLIVQSFYTSDLIVVRNRLPGVGLAALTRKAFNFAGINGAKNVRARWVSPEWVISRAYVKAAHKAKRKVVPFTLNSRTSVRQAKTIGVDALITDDPVMARRVTR